MLELRNVTAAYGSEEILRGISASFAAGQLISIVGPNGSGKSTLLKTVLGLLPASGGEIFLDGAALESLGRLAIARRMAYLAQGKGSADMTVGQLVLHGRFPHLRYPRIYRDADRRMAEAAMEKMGLTDLAAKPLSALSGGMRQKAYIAMALAQETEYILLDEPATYLDISHQLELMRLLRALADSGRCIVAVMHDLPLALNFSDSVAVLAGGEFRKMAAPEEICASGILEEVFGVAVGKTSEDGYGYRYKR